jgi:nucleotide-binding universal stress UspA family protein
MFSHIVIPVNFTRANDKAVAAAIGLARSGKGRVTLLHVVERIQHVPVRELKGFYATLTRAAEAKMKPLARRFERQRIPVWSVVLLGRRAEEIVEYAARREASLVVMSSHRLDPSHRGRGLAAISYQVALLAPCAVMLVK